MAIDTTIHRDAEGRVALTPEQAEALARRDLLACGYPAPGDHDADHAVMAAIQRAGEYPAAALARWVLAWAPVVRAADAQADADDDAYMDRCSIVEVTVRAARGEVQHGE